MKDNSIKVEPEPDRFAFRAMACACEVVLSPELGIDNEALARAAMDEVGRIERKYSRYLPDSIVSHINAAAGGGPVDCDEETWSLLTFADELYRSSDGLFDLTAGVLRRVWNFATPRLPSREAVYDACQLIGWQSVERSSEVSGGPGRIRLPKTGMEIDFGGFGKEYAADRAGHLLSQLGVRHGYVNLGGDIRVIGPKPGGAPWMMGIRDPRAADRIIATIPIASGALATSGDYERYFDLDGRRYCHVLDPCTGWPVSFWQAVSVVAPLTVVAGACTTVAMLRAEAGLDYLARSGFAYLAVDYNGTHYHSDAASAQAT